MKKFKKEYESVRIAVAGDNQLITKDNLTDELYAYAIKSDPKLANLFEDSTEKKDVPPKV
jgi:hypothetical protein